MNPIISTRRLGFHWETKDPFLFCAHHKDNYPSGNELMGPSDGLQGRSLGSDFDEKQDWRMYHGRKIPGFPVHPHRGFETITIVLSGVIDHTDSAGGAGRYGEGDVQWMTAGKGLQHSEMFPLVNRDKDNTLELFQIWLNLPAAKKKVPTYFKMIWKENIAKSGIYDDEGRVTEVILITGKANNVTVDAPSPDSWAADTSNDVTIMRLKMQSNAKYTIPAATKGVNRMLYAYNGSGITINGAELPSGHSAELMEDMDLLIANGDTESELLFLQGMPIKEPVKQYGPFVMNTDEEINETFREYQLTEFGGWPWPASEHVHGDNPRFAKYADGTVEYPDKV